MPTAGRDVTAYSSARAAGAAYAHNTVRLADTVSTVAACTVAYALSTHIAV
jgi:hypothetical protein